MYQTRQKSTTKLPIRRKGTKYVAKALSHPNNSVPVVIAVRDMLKLAKTAKEVKHMIKSKMLKLNGRPVKSYLDSIRLFNIFEADKPYVLTLLQTGKFTFEPVKKHERLCKVINKCLVTENKIQLNLHDGSNILSKDKIAVGDSVYIDFEGKIKSHVSLEKGKKIFIMSGKYIGSHGIIKSIKDNLVDVKLDSSDEAVLNKSQVVAL
ncbi:MAG: hypothetical protein Q8L29_00380 [archaeon]|nr:hypothetical protein [archaeon]